MEPDVPVLSTALSASEFTARGSLHIPTSAFCGKIHQRPNGTERFRRGGANQVRATLGIAVSRSSHQQTVQYRPQFGRESLSTRPSLNAATRRWLLFQRCRYRDSSLATTSFTSSTAGSMAGSLVLLRRRYCNVAF